MGMKRVVCAVVVAALLLFLILALAVNLLFQRPAPLPLLEARWSAGDALAYAGSAAASLVAVLAVVYTVRDARDGRREDRVLAARPYFSLTSAARTPTAGGGFVAGADFSPEYFARFSEDGGLWADPGTWDRAPFVQKPNTSGGVDIVPKASSSFPCELQNIGAPATGFHMVLASCSPAGCGSLGQTPAASFPSGKTCGVAVEFTEGALGPEGRGYYLAMVYGDVLGNWYVQCAPFYVRGGEGGAPEVERIYEAPPKPLDSYPGASDPEAFWKGVGGDVLRYIGEMRGKAGLAPEAVGCRSRRCRGAARGGRS